MKTKMPIKIFVGATLALFLLFGCSDVSTNADVTPATGSPNKATPATDDTANENQPIVDQVCLAQAKTEEERLACVIPRQPDDTGNGNQPTPTPAPPCLGTEEGKLGCMEQPGDTGNGNQPTVEPTANPCQGANTEEEKLRCIGQPGYRN